MSIRYGYRIPFCICAVTNSPIQIATVSAQLTNVIRANLANLLSAGDLMRDCCEDPVSSLGGLYGFGFAIERTTFSLLAVSQPIGQSPQAVASQAILRES